jgi:hypothetical protein
MKSARVHFFLAMIMSLAAAGCGSGGSHADRAMNAADVGTAADASDVADDESGSSNADERADDGARDAADVPQASPSDADDGAGPGPDSRDATPESPGAVAVCGSFTDPRNCGTCGNDCTKLPHVRPDQVICNNGACQIPAGGCFAGFAHCSRLLDSGCETDLSLAASCGGCTNRCATLAPLCQMPSSGPATCVAACAPGLTSCAQPRAPFGPIVQHCVDLQSHRDHCGACGTPCRIPGAEAACVAGSCVMDKCLPRAADCDAARPGCETLISTFFDCLGCGDSCAAAHATGTCGAAGCARVCHPGRGNCDPTKPDCETALDTGTSCGACSAACPADRPLCGGPRGTKACVSACAAPTPDLCGTSCTALQSDPDHCGTCGVACEDYQICDGGRCSPRYVHTDLVSDPSKSDLALSQGLFPVAIAIGPDGSYFVGGNFKGEIDFDPGAPQDLHRSSGTINDFFITKFTADGRYAWTRTFGGPTVTALGGLAVAPDGAVVATGHFAGVVDFDPGPGVEAHTAVSADAFVLRLAADGSLVWVRIFAQQTGSWPSPRGVVAANDDTIVTIGVFAGSFDFDPGPGIDIRDSTGPGNMYAVKLSGAGTLIWARTFDGRMQPRTMALHPNGTVLIGGEFTGTADFDPGVSVDPRTAVEMSDAFAVHLGVDGAGLGGLTFQFGMYEDIRAIAFDSDGSTYLGGYASGIAAEDFFLRKRSPTGITLLSRTAPALLLLAAAPGGGFLAGGTDVRGSVATDGVFVRKHDGNGDPVWTIPSPMPDHAAYAPNLVAADATKLLILGYTDGRADFDPGGGRDFIPAAGLFISRYDL